MDVHKTTIKVDVIIYLLDFKWILRAMNKFSLIKVVVGWTLFMETLRNSSYFSKGM